MAKRPEEETREVTGWGIDLQHFVDTRPEARKLALQRSAEAAKLAETKRLYLEPYLSCEAKSALDDLGVEEKLEAINEQVWNGIGEVVPHFRKIQTEVGPISYRDGYALRLSFPYGSSLRDFLPPRYRKVVSSGLVVAYTPHAKQPQATYWVGDMISGDFLRELCNTPDKKLVHIRGEAYFNVSGIDYSYKDFPLKDLEAWMDKTLLKHLAIRDQYGFDPEKLQEVASATRHPLTPFVGVLERLHLL